MRFLLSILIIFGLGFAVNMGFPWWAIVILSFLVSGFLNRNGFLAFLAAFIGVFLLWAGYAFILDGGDQAALSSRLGQIFNLPSGLGIIALSGLVAALPSAVAAVAGSCLFDVFYLKREKEPVTAEKVLEGKVGE